MYFEGMERLEATIHRHFHHPRLRDQIRSHINNCIQCATDKTGRFVFGKLAHREAIPIPWQDVHVDYIGNWTIKLNGIKMTFCALTSVEPVTNLLGIQCLRNKTSVAAWEALANSYLARYPRPL